MFASILLLLAADPDVDAIAKKLNSKKSADIVAALEMAAKLEKDNAEPLLKRISEIIMTANEKTAALAADCMKAHFPEIHSLLLKLRSEKDLDQVPNIRAIGALEKEGKPLGWIVCAIVAKKVGDFDEDEFVKEGLGALRSIEDASDAHWKMVKNYESTDIDESDEWVASFKFFMENSPERKLEFTKILIARPAKNWGEYYVGLIGEGEANSKAALPKLKTLAKLSPSKPIRDAAESAIEKDVKAPEKKKNKKP